MESSRRDRDHRDSRHRDNHSREERTPSESFLSGFNIAAVVCVVLPLFVLIINCLREGGGRMGDWFREDGSLARGFVYIWSMIVFFALVGYVNNEMNQRAEGGIASWFSGWGNGGGIDAKKSKPLVVALALFANLCLLCIVLIVGAGEGAEELGRSIGEGQFTGTVFLTFVFWLIWSVGSLLALRRISDRGGSGRDSDHHTDYICNPAI